MSRETNGLDGEEMLGEFILLLFWAGTIRKLHVEDISQVLIAQVDKVECKGEKEQGGMSLIITARKAKFRRDSGTISLFLFC